MKGKTKKKDFPTLESETLREVHEDIEHFKVPLTGIE